jgi:hypothetical protein
MLIIDRTFILMRREHPKEKVSHQASGTTNEPKQ